MSDRLSALPGQPLIRSNCQKVIFLEQNKSIHLFHNKLSQKTFSNIDNETIISRQKEACDRVNVTMLKYKD